jgi:hypothetical protein
MADSLRKWDYKTIKVSLGGILGGKIDEVELSEQLEKAGNEGWELISVLTTALYQGRTQDAALIFKRPRL